MRTARLGLAAVAVLLASTTSTLLAVAVAAPAAHADTPSQGAVLFADDFTGAANSAPDAGVWEEYSACSYDATAAFGGIDCGVDSVLDGAGHLVIPATAPDATHPNGQGSALRTKTFGFTYGTMTARMKMPAASGSWPAFWSLNNARTGGNPATGSAVGEVDAVESYTAFQNETIATAHSHTGSSATDQHAPENHCPAAKNIAITDWHDYAAKIEPGKVTFYLDGQQCGDPWLKSTDPARIWGFGPDRTADNWLILQHAVGGAGGQNPATGALGTVLVDRVEVRALDTTSAAVVSGTTYAVTNTCGGKALSAPDATSVAQLKTADPSSTDTLQRWAISTYPDGTWKLKNVASSMTANVFYASTANSAVVGQYSDSGGTNAAWTITPGINGQYTIVNVNSGKALDVPANNPAAGVGVAQYQPNGSCGQTWQLTAA